MGAGASTGPPGSIPTSKEEALAVGFTEEQKLERLLLKMNMEKQYLESQYAKMPASSGRTLAQRKLKREIEERLGKLNKEISSSRLSLKRLTAGR